MEKTYKGIRKPFKKAFLIGLLGGIFLPTVFLSYAIAQEIKIISDEETEIFLAEIIKPLFNEAKLKFNRNNIYIVDDISLNAFISDGNRMFVNTGTLIKADSANEISGVLAHETGHIMGGHILRQKIKSQNLREISLASLVLAGAAAAVSGKSDMAMAILLGSNSSILNSFSNYKVSEERSADEAAAKLLEATGVSPEGMLNFMKKIKQENKLSGLDDMPYFRSHPVTDERIMFFENVLKNKKYDKKIQNRNFLRIKAKLKAFLQKPEQTFRDYPLSQNDNNALYAHSIAFWKQLNFEKSLQIIDNLIIKEPQNPFFYELKGQILFDKGKLSEAEKSFAKAYELMPASYLMQINYAQAILENDSADRNIKKAIVLLQKSLIEKPNSFSWQLLAKAYGLKGDMSSANHAAAEYSFRIGNLDVAEKQLNEAKKLNPPKHLNLKIEDLEKRINDLKTK